MVEFTWLFIILSNSRLGFPFERKISIWNQFPTKHIGSLTPEYKYIDKNEKDYLPEER